MDRPNWISPPGITVAEVMKHKGMTVGELASNLNISARKCAELLEGELVLDQTLANSLSSVLGFNEKFWLNREKIYRLRRNEIEEQWVSSFPEKDMKARGILRGQKKEYLKDLLRFFGVKNILEWNEKFGLEFKKLAFRKSQTYESDLYSVMSWVREAEIQVDNIKVGQWSAELLESKLNDFKKLTRERKLELFLPKLVDLCASCGVRLAIVKGYGKNSASGVTRFYKNHPLIILSFRFFADDHFWFTFFHEVGHLVLHEYTKLRVESWNITQSEENEELEANHFAEAVLINDHVKKQLPFTKKTTRAIINLANEAGVSPGIIVGQMQHKGIISYSSYNSYKRRYKWEEIENIVNIIYKGVNTV